MAKKGAKKNLRNLEKQKKKIIEDRTFGLKNKNKSKKVQRQVQALKNQIKDAGLSKQDRMILQERERRKQERQAAKEREKELQALFGKVEKPKPTETPTNETEEKKDSNREPTEQELLDALESLAVVEQELVDEADMTLEEYIEKERAKILTGTPVTEETFAKWKKFKQELVERERKAREDEQLESFKKSGTGLTGRALFQLKQDMFVDDEAASDEKMVKREDVEMDEDLFLDDDDDDDEDGDDVEEEEEYDPQTWKGETPKSLVVSLCGKLKVAAPVFTNISQGGGEGFAMSCTLPHLNKTFTCSKIYPNKRTAEHNAALRALRYLEKQQG